MTDAFNPRLWVDDDTARKDQYDPRQVFTKSTDDKGHSCETRVPLPPHLHAKVKELVMRGTVPGWRSMGDVFRDALHHRLIQIAELDGLGLEYEMLLRVERLNEQQKLARETREAVMVTIDNFRIDLRNARDDGDDETLAELLVIAQEQIENWRTFYAEKLAAVIEPYL